MFTCRGGVYFKLFVFFFHSSIVYKAELRTGFLNLPELTISKPSECLADASRCDTTKNAAIDSTKATKSQMARAG